jgi:hypothetical protein
VTVRIALVLSVFTACLIGIHPPSAEATNGNGVGLAALSGTAAPSTPTATPTSRSTTTPASTATPTPAVASYKVRSVKLVAPSVTVEYAWKNRSAAATRLKVDQAMKIIAFVEFGAITGRVSIGVAIRVTTGTRTVLFKKNTFALTAHDAGVNSYALPFTASAAGTYRVTATVFVGGKHQHKTITLVASR